MTAEQAEAILSQVTYRSSVDGRTRNLPAHVRAALAPILVKAIADETEACAKLTYRYGCTEATAALRRRVEQESI